MQLLFTFCFLFDNGIYDATANAAVLTTAQRHFIDWHVSTSSVFVLVLLLATD